MIACAFEEGVERIFILSSKELKDRFLKEITALSQIFAMSIPSFEADVIKDDVAFFQAVKARINKFNPSGVKSNYEIDTAIKQIVDEALSSDGVIDVFEPAGIKTPDISILSDELGLTDDQYAFYSVLNLNDSTKMLDDHKMKELIHHIVDVIRKNATVAGVREVRAKVRLTVRMLLIKYGYPPDLARMEADRVVEQSELLAEGFTKA